MTVRASCLCLCLSLAATSVAAQSIPFFGKGRRAQKKTAEQTREQSAGAVAPTPHAEKPEPPRPANGSLFTNSAAGVDLVSDFLPRRVGDLIFVDVIETSSATVTSNAKRNRDSGTLGGLVTAAGGLPSPGAAAVAAAAGALGTRKYEGSGTTGRQSKLQARIAARVVEVLPNGDFRIEAQKIVKINKEDERLLLHGIVRRRDISADNTVPTTSVGDLRVELNGKGVASADNAPGWLFRLFEKISPF